MTASDCNTKHHLGRWLGRQPEDDKREEREQDARQDEHVVVEGSDTSERHGEREVWVRRHTARVIFDVLLSRVIDNVPLVARRVVAYVNLQCHITYINPLIGKGNYSATSNNMKLVHWPLMDGLLHLVQRRKDWAGPQPTQAHPRCTKCKSPSINCQYTNHRIAV